MSMIETKNFNARCVEQDDSRSSVLHEVSFDLKESGVWGNKTMRVMATDPIDAINYVRSIHREG